MADSNVTAIDTARTPRAEHSLFCEAGPGVFTALGNAIEDQRRELWKVLGVLESLASTVTHEEWSCETAPNLDSALDLAKDKLNEICDALDPFELRKVDLAPNGEKSAG